MKGVWKYSMVIAINLTSICCVHKEKIVKSTHNEERSVHAKSESCKFSSFVRKPVRRFYFSLIDLQEDVHKDWRPKQTLKSNQN